VTTRNGLVSIEEAVDLYERMPPFLKAGSIHPAYVKADAARDEKLNAVFWMHQEEENIYLHGFHTAIITNTEWQDAQSPYGYGGPLATTQDLSFLRSADMAFKKWALKNNLVAEFIRFHPILENWKYYIGQNELDRSTTWIDCNQQDILMGYEVRQRTAIRKAIKSGVQIKWLTKNELLALFPDFYLTAMKNINASAFYFFPESYFLAILSLPFISGAAAFLGDEVIAMSLFFEDGVGEYHLSGKSLKGAQASASNLLIHEAALRMQANGIEKFYLGGGSTTQPDDSLLFFKTGFSKNRSDFRIAKRVLIPAAYEELKRLYPEQYAQFPNRILFYRS